MHGTLRFLSLCLLLTANNCLNYHHNYNYSRVHELALIADPLPLPPRPVSYAHHAALIPTLIEYSQLRKYQLRDTNYRPEEQSLSHEDHFLLFNMEPPEGVFQDELIHIENYRLLEMRKFQVTINNPSTRLKIVITQVSTDRAEVRRDDERGGLPVSLHPGASHEFNFIFLVECMNPQFLQGCIYFFIEIYDGSILAEEKVYARKVSAAITPNHLRLGNQYYNNCPHYHVIVVKNYQVFDIGIVFEGKKKFETVEGVQLDGENQLAPTQSIKLLMEGRKMNLVVHTVTRASRVSTATRGSSPAFPPLTVKVECEDPVSIDYFNIGLLTDERTVFTFPLSISSHRQDNASLAELSLQASSQTVTFEQLPSFTGLIPPRAKHLAIGVIKIFARKKAEKKSVITLRARVVVGNEEFWTEQKLFYQQIRSPISAGAKRFIDLRKLNPKKERFPLKNNLNVPLFLTKFSCDERVIQLSWTGERRKMVYPNHSIEELSLLYVGPKQIPLSPQKHVIMLEFNGNLMIPIEMVVYDQTLQCLLDNQEHPCSHIHEIDFGYFRDQKAKGKQLIVRNWNPEPMPLSLQLPALESQQHGIQLEVDIYGPLPNDNQAKKNKQQRDFILKPNHFLVINIEVQLLGNGTSAALPLKLVTNIEAISILLVVRVENGTIALIPQVVRFQAPTERTIEYLNLVSTYSQKYRITNVSTNCSNVIVAIPPHGDLQGNQFVGMTVVYEPYLSERNITDGDWSTPKKQTEYYLHRLKKEYEPIIYTQIKLTTSIQLEARSTIIIAKNYKPLIPDSHPAHTSEAIRQLRFILPKRKPKIHRYGEPRQLYEISFEVKNQFPFPIKYKPFLVSDIKFALIESFFKQYRESRESRLETVFFCISQGMKSQHRLTPSAIKDIFRLQVLPDEYFLDVYLNEGGQTEMAMRPKNPKNKTISVIPRTLDFEFMMLLDKKQYRTCYYLSQHQLITRLLLTELPYRILEEDGERTFRQFIKAELHNLDHIAFFENESDLQTRIQKHYYQYCWEEPHFIVYRFCDSLHARVHSVTSHQPVPDKDHQPTPDRDHHQPIPDKDHRQPVPDKDQTIVVAPGDSQTVTLQVFNPADKFSFYVVLANNFTQFETYQAEVEIRSPHIYVRHDYISPLFSEAADEVWGKWKGASLLPIELFSEDYIIKDTLLEGTRVFEIINDGEGAIVVDHMGIDQKYFSCGQKGIEIYGFTCRSEEYQSDQAQRAKRNFDQKFVVPPMSRHNLTVKFILNLRAWPSGKRQLFYGRNQVLRYTIYLYDEKGYHFKLPLVFRIADPHLATSIDVQTASANEHKNYGYLTISGLSLLILGAFFMRSKSEENNPAFKAMEERERAEEDQYKRLYRLRRLGRILKQPSYYDSNFIVGTKLNKRGLDKPIHKVTEDLLLSAKEVTQRELKRYFNQSEESAIGAFLEINHHHLSMTSSISDHEVIEEPPSSSEDEPSSQEEVSQYSSNLPEGEEVDLGEDQEEGSWYDFNKEALNSSNTNSNNNNSINPNNPNNNNSINYISEHTERQQNQQLKFYNVFRTDVGLRKPPFPQLPLPNPTLPKNSPPSKKKWQ